MKKLFLTFALVLAAALIDPVSASAETAEVTAIRYGDESNQESPNTSDLSSISSYIMMLTASGSVAILMKGRRKRHETD